jgi:hypothetical protein
MHTKFWLETGKRSLGKRRRTMKDNIKIDFSEVRCVGGWKMAQDRVQWEA